MSIPRSPALSLVLAALTVTLTASAANAQLLQILTAADASDPVTGEFLEVVPGLPVVIPGPGGNFDPAVISIDFSRLGDIDIVARAGMRPDSFAVATPAILDPTIPIPVGTAEPFAGGIPVDFQVTSATPHPAAPNHPSLPYGVRTFADFDGIHVGVAAFPDLDGDGFIGVTALDGNIYDDAVERAELRPVARHVYTARFGAVNDVLHIGIGGPTGATLRLALTAGAKLGQFRADYFEGELPDGPAIFTGLPFHPITDPGQIQAGGELDAPDGTNPLELLGVKIRPAFVPDPTDPRYGEAFTLALDGSSPSIDVIEARSGAFRGFAAGRSIGFFQRADPRVVRPGVDVLGRRTVFELPRELTLKDNGSGSSTRLRILPVDRLGNIADLPQATPVTVSTVGAVRITAPDLDGDPYRENILVVDARGVEIVLNDSGGTFDGPERDRLTISSEGVLNILDIYLPDPDVDDSGAVDATDAGLVRQRILDNGITQLGDEDFDPLYDLNVDGRIDDADVRYAESYNGRSVPVP